MPKQADKDAKHETESIPEGVTWNSVMRQESKNIMDEGTNRIVVDAVPGRWIDNNEEEIRRRQEKARIDGILNRPSTSTAPTDNYYNYNDFHIRRELQNKRALRADDNTYKLETFEKNVMIIFNHYEVVGYKVPRLGTHRDVIALYDTFTLFNFEIIECRDKTKYEIFTILDSCKKMLEKGLFKNVESMNDFTEYGCVAVVVLTHGGDGGLLHAKDITYNESDIIERFDTRKNPSLITKPKLFIFQACRGTSASQAAAVNASEVQPDGPTDENQFYTLPIESDMMALHSTYPGNISYRETENGSWMIQNLCARINELAATDDLLSIVTRVQRDVAIDREKPSIHRWTGEPWVDKQMPILSSTLIRKLELKAYSNAPPKLAVLDSKPETQVDSIINGFEKKLFPREGKIGVDLHYFDYITRCTANFVDETDNEGDQVARSYLTLANTFKDHVEFDDSKMAMAGVMSEHLEKNIKKNRDAYKYIYLKNIEYQ